MHLEKVHMSLPRGVQHLGPRARVISVAPLIACSTLWLKLGGGVQQPPQQITVPKEVLYNCVAACLKHACHNACDLHKEKSTADNNCLATCTSRTL